VVSVFINNHFSHEKTYIIDVFFNVFLGLDYQIYFSREVDDYMIQLENGNTFVVEDHFFKRFTNTYLDKQNIPGKINYATSAFFPEKDLPVIYGTNKITEEQKDDQRKIISGVDIFASGFFMLTRWEEYVIRGRDEQDRFLGQCSLAFRNNFLHRPVVNEYVEFLWNVLRSLEINKNRRKRDYELIPTHDVDFLHFPNLSCSDLKNNLRLKGIKESLAKLKHAVFKDPYDTFSYLMNLSEGINTKARFYFVDGQGNYDAQEYLNTRRFQNLMAEIHKRGHVVGFHSGYYAYNNKIKAKKEKERLEKSLKFPVKEGRQHYLCFKVPDTWTIQEQIGMQMDCTLGYHDQAGFRCGVCYEYPVFDFLERRPMNLWERPLVVMDTTLVIYNKYSPDQAREKLQEIVEQIKKYNGQLVLLWHNTAISNGRWRDFNSVFENVYNYFYAD
jgi:uncharacterized protein YlzI (FlbEa/FlbD family)